MGRCRGFAARLAFALTLAALAVTLTVMPARALAAPVLSYRTHVQTYGWQGWRSAPATAGTTGLAKRVEAVEIKLAGAQGGIEYRTHVQSHGWQGWVANGALSGTEGKAKRVEAVEIRLTGDVASQYDVQYRVHVQSLGWQDWVGNGMTAGTTGIAKRVEALELRLVPKAPTSYSVAYRAHVQSHGWQGWVGDGELSGTEGEAKRVEALQFSIGPGVEGDVAVEANAHVQSIGWQGWRGQDAIIGTEGNAKRIEAIQLRLTGDDAEDYDLYYRVHMQSVGWLDWAQDGETAGSVGFSKRLEAIEAKLVKHGERAPGETDNHQYFGDDVIMGNSLASQASAVRYFESRSSYPAAVYAPRGAATIEDFVRILFEEAQVEGVRADVLFCQIMLETGWLRFGGDVKAEQCNFGGLGATGGGVPGLSFDSVRTGLRAQTQHLKAYASTKPLVNQRVDPRFGFVSRGCAPTVQGLSGKWAVGSDYGNNIATLLHQLDSMG